MRIVSSEKKFYFQKQTDYKGLRKVLILEKSIY